MIVEQETMPAAAASIRRSRALVEGVCSSVDASEGEHFALKLAIDEAVSNLVEHAYEGRADGTFTVRVEADENRFRIEITDTGTRFDPTTAPTPDLEANWNERTVGGLGLHFVRNVMDEVTYASDGAGNHLVLTKYRKSRNRETTRRE